MNKGIIYYGPINNDNKEKFIKKAKEYLKENRGDKFFYILPSGNLLTRYRERLMEGLIGVLDINVITFDDIVNRLLDSDFYTKIDESTKETIISKIINDLDNRGNISYYKNLIDKEGFISSLSYIISKNKMSLVEPKTFNLEIPNEKRFKEIGLIYEMYQEFINENKLLDNEETFIKAIENFNEKKDIFSQLDFIIIDEFFDFRPQELAILNKLTTLDIDIYINMPFKTKERFKTVENTLDTLRDMGFTIEENNKTNNKTYFEQISDNIFNSKLPILSKTDKIKLIKAPNKYLELKKICEEIKRLEYNGVSLKDIAVIVGNLNNYREILSKVLKEEGIPSTLKEEISLYDIPLVREVLSLIELKINNFKKDNIIKTLKSGYLDISEGSIDSDKLENLFYNLGIQDMNSEFKEKIEKEKRRLRLLIKNDDENKKVYEDKLEDIVNFEFIMKDLTEKMSELPEKENPKGIKDSILDILDYYSLREKINDIYKKTDDYLLFYRDKAAYYKLMNIIERATLVAEITFKKEICIKEFYDIMVRILKDETIVMNQPNRKGISILTPTISRGLKFSYVFFVGLSQGEYPNIKEDNWFFREEDYSIFKKVGIDLKNYDELFDKESLIFILGITRTKEGLIISYSEDVGKDTSIPSIFLEEILNIFKGDKIENKVNFLPLDMTYLLKEKLEDVTHERELVKCILHKYYNSQDEQEHLSLLNNINKDVVKEIIEKIECEVKREENEFNEFDGLIIDKDIKNDLTNSFSNSRFSITQLETYGKCPFRFLYEVVLDVKEVEKEVLDFSPIERGSLYHKVLAEYYNRHKDDFRNYVLKNEQFKVEDTKKEIEELVIDEVYNLGVKYINNMWKLRIEQITDNIINLVNKDLERLKKYKGNLYPSEFEVEFGFKEKYIIKIDDIEIPLLGKIDRIDMIDEGDSQSFIVYDYKYSSYGIKYIKDILEGISFQLPVYIMSQIDKGKEVIGGGYIIIKDGKVYIQMIKEDKRSYLNKRKSKSTLSDEEWNLLIEEVKKKIKDYIEKIFMGDFRLNPHYCEDFCQYKNMCRYDEERILRKGQNNGIN
ncbi:PD-(D/E)XK nuclease family protein [Thermohalobacter berrensis]|uniref:Uncharacterized protein n=1 Tax=Thermohalobacter berrensis TaxID=99594 RepID=A0A419T143_9FIRM|nr:PD-(D/E)XK nuclease family protein [Thermohalobacter berrensis]RKD31187.1 hypothetical protein BET03_03405 [Thermohalobacter berrensis]